MLAFAVIAGVLRAEGQAEPALSLQHPAADVVQLWWPSADRNWVLQATPDLSDFTPWQTVLHSPSLAGPNFSLQLGLPTGSKNYFFRLRQQATSGTLGGLNFLYDSQDTSGTWGASGSTRIRDTAAALDALAAFGRSDATTSFGLSALAALTARNNDELSRQMITLAAASLNVDGKVTQLRAAENAASLDSASLEYPGGGWGLASGFGNSTIDTALALRALAGAGKIGGLSIVKESLAGSATSSAKGFTVPPAATNLRLLARQRTVPVRYSLTYPNGGGTSFVDLAAGTTPTTVGFPITTGTVTLTARNNSTSAGSHSAEVAFVGSDGFDFGNVTAALSWLGGAQNADGGWSLVASEPSHLMITTEVVRGLAACGGAFAPASVLSNAAAWLFTKQNADGGFSSDPPTSNSHETSLAVLALQAAQTTSSLASAAAYLRSTQLYNGSWGDDPLQTALAVRALRMPPFVSPIPGQNVTTPAAFATINLDNYVADPDNADNQIAWSVTGNTLLNVSIVNRVATITYTPGSNITEQLTFTATDPDGYTASSTATFSVVFQVIDHTIARGGFATGTRSFTTTQANFNQIASYNVSQAGVPAGVTYSTTGVFLIPPDTIEVDYQISVSPAAATGIQQFSITYGLRDSASQPLVPLFNNVFNFTIQVTP